MKSFTVIEHAHSLEIKFHIPSSANALSLVAARELGALPRSFKKNEKCVWVRSLHPRLFCSGGNLKDYQKLKGKAVGLKINREIEKHLDDFAAWPVFKLAVIEGDVLGGGMEWLARFDFRWATSNACFSFWQRRIGLSTGWGGGRAWAESIGGERMRRLLIDSRLYCAEQALTLGLVDKVLPSWRIDKAVEEWSTDLFQHKQCLLDLSKWSLKKEASIFRKLWMGETHRTILSKWK